MKRSTKLVMSSLRLSLLLSAATLGAVSCTREQGAPPPGSVSSAAPTATAPMQGAPGAPAPTVVVSQTGEPINLDREVRKWILRNQRPPKDFEDFAATAGIEVPPPPPGKKYVIDKTMHVVLAKR